MSNPDLQPESLIRCVRCDQALWTVKVLSWTPDEKPKATEWHSANPLIKANRPKTWNCPLCKKEFATKDKTGAYTMKTVNLVNQKRQLI